jgi:hypothetical protein
MDDFLHNLRSGKLKQPDRGRQSYQDYKGPQRRAGNERRKPDYYAKVTAENFALVKDSLDRLTENQKHIANAIAAREKTEIRIANALETIASMLERRWAAQGALSRDNKPTEPDNKAMDSHDSVEASDDGPKLGPGDQKLSAKDKPAMLDMIAAMRSEGQSWEKIARHMDERKVPTVSGKGKWRGPTIKKFWDTNSADSGA